MNSIDWIKADVYNDIEKTLRHQIEAIDEFRLDMKQMDDNDKKHKTRHDDDNIINMVITLTRTNHQFKPSTPKPGKIVKSHDRSSNPYYVWQNLTPRKDDLFNDDGSRTRRQESVDNLHDGEIELPPTFHPR